MSFYLGNNTRYDHVYYGMPTGTRMQSIEWCHFQWPWMTPNPDFKVMSLSDAKYLRNGTRQTHRLQRTTNRDLHMSYSRVSFQMTSRDLQWLSKIFNGTKHCTASLQQPSFLYSVELQWLAAHIDSLQQLFQSWVFKVIFSAKARRFIRSIFRPYGDEWIICGLKPWPLKNEPNTRPLETLISVVHYSTFSALGVSHVKRSINVRYLLTYLITIADKNTKIVQKAKYRKLNHCWWRWGFPDDSRIIQFDCVTPYAWETDLWWRDATFITARHRVLYPRLQQHLTRPLYSNTKLTELGTNRTRALRECKRIKAAAAVLHCGNEHIAYKMPHRLSELTIIVYKMPISQC